VSSWSDEMVQLGDHLLAGATKDGIEAVSTGAVVVRNSKALILVRAASNPFMPARGDLPGGYTSAHEALLDCLARELHEETGLHLMSIDRYLGHFDFITGRGMTARQLNFLAQASHGSISLNALEHSGYEWVSLSDEPELQRLRVSKEVLAILRMASA
jgi:8-oxo-dGTP diphosphatase